MKILIFVLSLSSGAFAGSRIEYLSATVAIPDHFTILKRESGDCPGLRVTVLSQSSKQELTLRLGDAFWSFQPTSEELKDLEHFEREPGSWFGYRFVVLRRGDKRVVEMRYPIENVQIRATLASDADFRPLLAVMKEIGVELTSGYHLQTSEEDRSFELRPPN